MIAWSVSMMTLVKFLIPFEKKISPRNNKNTVKKNVKWGKKTPGMLVKMTCDRFEIFWCDRICRQERLNSDNNLTLLDGDLT